MGYIPHEQISRELAASHVVLCSLDDVPGAERIYPAKIFELMYLGRPCLTLSPPGALADLVRETHMGSVLAPRDPAPITAWLIERLRELRQGRFDIHASASGIGQYHRREQAGQFARVFRRAMAALPSRGHAS
jgi:hypothetical protein